MKYSVALAALAAVAYALPQDASSITSAPAASASLDPYIASLASCVSACAVGDVTCQAQCAGVARPNSSQAVETNECAAKCDQGDGSKEATEAYAKCQADCFASLFPSTQTVAPFAPGSPSSGSAGASVTASGSNSASAGSSPSGTSSPTGTGSTNASGSPTGSAAQASGSGAASSNSVKIIGAGLAGFMAIFAM
ncbi:hypothetical protein K458DRAFT_405479 [Lentithecium fluviatile CBS 122367]|uniref:Extracellular membrane protein CFEM domain-containing protein n=1 Tax=Lentithecium fluviatile CBS 122367 TaxID=1168545 RepID=A0A6G1IWU7_9PLEO|nr:hypothetical protein K458DRAFT_405479 [Lentithecium fluviatile CBS 122367]